MALAIARIDEPGFDDGDVRHGMRGRMSGGRPELYSESAAGYKPRLSAANQLRCVAAGSIVAVCCTACVVLAIAGVMLTIADSVR